MNKYQTNIIHIDAANLNDLHLQPAAQALADGQLVAFPTETVYGLGANALDEQAVAGIFKAKGRPADNPLIVHVASIEDAALLTDDLTDLAATLFETFAPGPLTLVLKRSEIVPDLVTAGLDTVAIRIPAHPAARRLIQLAGVPIAAPSANRSGRPSPTRGWHVEQDLDGLIPYIVEAGDCEFGLESTVVDVTGNNPVILRPGALSAEDILAAAGQLGSRRQTGQAPRSPGMKYRHYAPDAHVLVAEGETADQRASHARSLAKRETDRNRLVGLIGQAAFLAQVRLPSLPSFSLGQSDRSAAAGLFDALRRLDMDGVAVMIVEGLPENGIGAAYMNRLRKAASAADESTELGGT